MEGMKGFWRSLGAVGALATCVETARSQESVIFSLTADGTAPFGTIADSELAIWDSGLGQTRPWLSLATSAFYAGDIDGDAQSDEWVDVDAIWVRHGEREEEVQFSFNTTFAGFLDGDLLRLTSAGGIIVSHSEAALISAFGLLDGQMDIDGLHVAPHGRIYVSFADNETSRSLSTDAAGVITDGSVVWWDPVVGSIGVALTEANVDAVVSAALGTSTKTGDTLGVAMDGAGNLAVSVQSPSAHDASVFTTAQGGRLLVAEATLGLGGTPELDALDLVVAPVRCLAARATPRFVPANQVTVVDLDSGLPNHLLVLTLSLAKGESDNFPFDGFLGLALDPADSLFAASLSDLLWTWGITDAAGHAAISFEPAPPGLQVTVYAQAYDLDGDAVGMPIAIELEG